MSNAQYCGTVGYADASLSASRGMLAALAIGTSVTLGPSLRLSALLEADGENYLLVPGDRDAKQLQILLDCAQEDLARAVASATEPTVPEVFSLSPLSRRRVIVKVQQVRPATFRFAVEDIPGPEEIES